MIEDLADLDAELIEISENLHRAELSALQRDEQVARWIELTTVKRTVEKDHVAISAQSAPKLGRPESGINAASRELGIERTDAQRAMRVASLSPEAKAAATAMGFDDNRTALLAAAREAEPKKQVEVITARVEKSLVQHRIIENIERRRLAHEQFISSVSEIECLLAEIEYQGNSDDEDAEFTPPYSDLNYSQITQRYKPILGLDTLSYNPEVKGTSGVFRRVKRAQEEIFAILCRAARAEI